MRLLSVGGGGGGVNRLPVFSRQAVEFPQVLASINKYVRRRDMAEQSG